MALLPSTSRHRAAALLGIVAALAISSNTLGGFWRPTVTVAGPFPRDYTITQDLSAAGTRVVTAFTHHDYIDEGSPLAVSAYVSESTSGDSFGPKTLLTSDPAGDYGSVALATGGGRHWAAFSEQAPTAGHPGRERVKLASKAFGQGSWSVTPVSTNDGPTRWPDLARTPERLFISYAARVAGTWRVMVQDRRSGDETFGEPTIVGKTGENPPVMDATPSTISVVWDTTATWNDNGAIRLRRGHIGGSPSYAVTWDAATTVGTGRMPSVVSDGERLALFYIRAQDVYVRISTNDGEDFTPEKKILDGNDDDQPGSLLFRRVDAAMAGSRIVVSAAGGAVDGGEQGYRASSTDGGATWHRVNVGMGRQVVLTGEPGSRKVAEAWSGDEGRVVLYHRQS